MVWWCVVVCGGVVCGGVLFVLCVVCVECVLCVLCVLCVVCVLCCVCCVCVCVCVCVCCVLCVLCVAFPHQANKASVSEVCGGKKKRRHSTIPINRQSCGSKMPTPT